MTRRDRAVAGVAAVIALAAAHYEWFSIFGPPARWGTGVVELSPRIEHKLPPFTIELDSEKIVRDTAASATGILGRVLYEDRIDSTGETLLQTFTGKTWGIGQHLYYKATRQAPWRELPVPRDFVIGSPRLVTLNGRTVAAFTRWNPWWPYSYRRFWKSVFRRDLRSEHAIYALDLERETIRYLFPGDGLAMSKDRNYAATMNSTNGFSGHHTISIWDIRSNKTRPIFTDTETDPGSGSSFSPGWHKTTNYVVILGRGQKYGELNLVYSVADGLMYDADRTKSPDLNIQSK